MLINYFRTAWRNLWNTKFYTALNMVGLAIGLSIGIMIFLWVQDELSYDGFHRNAENIYKINSHIGTGSSAQVWSNAPSPLAVFCRQSIPEVSKAVRVMNRYDQVMLNYGNNKFLETNTAFVDPSFFTLFSFKLIQGDKEKPFADNHSIVVTQSVAKKYFGGANPIGKVVGTDNANYTVTGVIADFPTNSSIAYDILFPDGPLCSQFPGQPGMEDHRRRPGQLCLHDLP